MYRTGACRVDSTARLARMDAQPRIRTQIHMDLMRRNHVPQSTRHPGHPRSGFGRAVAKDAVAARSHAARPHAARTHASRPHAAMSHTGVNLAHLPAFIGAGTSRTRPVYGADSECVPLLGTDFECHRSVGSTACQLKSRSAADRQCTRDSRCVGSVVNKEKTWWTLKTAFNFSLSRLDELRQKFPKALPKAMSAANLRAAAMVECAGISRQVQMQNRTGILPRHQCRRLQWDWQRNGCIDYLPVRARTAPLSAWSATTLLATFVADAQTLQPTNTSAAATLADTLAAVTQRHVPVFQYVPLKAYGSTPVGPDCIDMLGGDYACGAIGWPCSVDARVLPLAGRTVLDAAKRLCLFDQRCGAIVTKGDVSATLKRRHTLSLRRVEVMHNALPSLRRTMDHQSGSALQLAGDKGVADAAWKRQPAWTRHSLSVRRLSLCVSLEEQIFNSARLDCDGEHAAAFVRYDCFDFVERASLWGYLDRDGLPVDPRDRPHLPMPSVEDASPTEVGAVSAVRAPRPPANVQLPTLITYWDQGAPKWETMQPYTAPLPSWVRHAVNLANLSMSPANRSSAYRLGRCARSTRMCQRRHASRGYSGFMTKPRLLYEYLVQHDGAALPDTALIVFADGRDVVWGGCDDLERRYWQVCATLAVPQSLCARRTHTALFTAEKVRHIRPTIVPPRGRSHHMAGSYSPPRCLVGRRFALTLPAAAICLLHHLISPTGRRALPVWRLIFSASQSTPCRAQAGSDRCTSS